MEANETERQQNVVLPVLTDAISTIVAVIIGTGVIIFIGKHFRGIGLTLAVIETLLAAFQTLKVLFVIVVDVAVVISVLSGKRRREKDETQMLWGTLIRTVELCIWISCLFVLYKFFYS